MKIFRFFIALAFYFSCNFCFSQQQIQVAGKQKLLIIYKQADRFYQEGEHIVNRKDYSEEKEIQLNKNALLAFHRLLSEINKSGAGYDSILFFTYFKMGVLEHYFGNLQAAGPAYANAIEIKQRLHFIADSFLFRPYLYLGIILYNENLFDSAVTMYKKAEAIAAKYSSPLLETERLFNTLGALYHETGNYKQAKNYFEKAILVLPASNPYYKSLLVNYNINLATSLTKTEDYEEAKKIYEHILPFEIDRDIILHNTGLINLYLDSVKKALFYFRQVHYADQRKIRLYNDFGLAFLKSGNHDSAWIYLHKADSLYKDKNSRTITRGLTFKLIGDLLLSENRYEEALSNYQKAIADFYPAYVEKEIAKNPETFSGIFSYINLFNTLTAKADAFEKLFRKNKNIADLEAALKAYTSAFKLTDYVEKSYDSDEARLFLNKTIYSVHSKPIDICLELFEKTKNNIYLEQAWQFDQRNKASILSFNVYENEIRNNSPKLTSSDREKELKESITRLSLKAVQLTDSIKLRSINNAIRDYEIELGKIQEKINAEQAYRGINQVANIPDVKQIQKQILDDNSTVLSYHLSEKELLILCVTKNNFEYKRIPLTNFFYPAIDSFVAALHMVTGDKKYSGSSSAATLYSFLIKPVFELVKSTSRLVIIPDDELNYIPFEALENEHHKYLVESFSIQYQYAASLLKPNRKKYNNDGTLAFAPFMNSGNKTFSRLQYSGEEINGIKGKSFTDQQATKQNFINEVNKFPVIHLATHAHANDLQSNQSFIAFYPERNNDLAAGNLYAQEIYNLNLDSTRLIILSACETGAGKLIRGEGLMSLSRAFTYAGCPNIVTSLWKAEDKTTAFITKQFHYYLTKGFVIDKALQKAKVDFLNSDEIDPVFKTPNYWSHLVFIGNYNPDQTNSYWKWFIGLFSLTAIIFFIYKRKGHS